MECNLILCYVMYIVKCNIARACHAMPRLPRHSTPCHATPPMQVMQCMHSMLAILGCMVIIAGCVTIHDGLYTRQHKDTVPPALEIEVLGAHRTDPVAFSPSMVSPLAFSPGYVKRLQARLVRVQAGVDGEATLLVVPKKQNASNWSK